MMQNKLFSSLDTPALLIDMEKLEANIREMAHLAADAGVKLRPHTKCHECVDIAKLQMEGGACGISVANLAKAERMAEGGIEDIMVVHPFYGDYKLEVLRKLLGRPGLKLTVVVDMIEQAQGISQVGQALGKEVPVLLKIDTGFGRFGCLPGEPALNLAREVCQLPAIRFVGIMTHAVTMGERTAEGVDRRAFEIASVIAGTARMLRREAIPVEEVCAGESGTARGICRHIKSFPEITELHPGRYVLGDMRSVNSFVMREDTCALSVLTTVISTWSSDRVVIDAGCKTLSSDPMSHLSWKPDYFFRGMPRYGSIKGRPDLWLGRLSAEVGVIYPMDPNRKVRLGERLEIVPNHAVQATNLHDEIYGVRDGMVDRVIAVTGRGKGN